MSVGWAEEALMVGVSPGPPQPSTEWVLLPLWGWRSSPLERLAARTMDICLLGV